MFLDYFIPVAYAQTTAKTTESVLQPTGKTGTEGISEFFNFILRNLGNWIGGIVIIVASFIIAGMVMERIRNKIIEKKGEEAQESVIILIQRTTKIIIVGIGIIIAAAINGFNFTAVIGALSLGIGFALKDVIATFISSIVLLSQNRIRIGDFIQLGDIMGTIISIDTRVTVLQAMDGSEVVIPNQQMLNSTIISYTMNPFRRIEILIGVDYNTDIPMVTSLIRGVLDKDPDIAPKPEPLVLLEDFAENALNIKVYFWIESRKGWLKIRSNVAARIRQAFNEVGINTPCPVRVLKIDEDDRAFLKTMDSLKKGYVPEIKPVPNREVIKRAAEATANAEPIPEVIFGKSKPQAETPAPAPKVPKVIPPEHPKKYEEPTSPPPSHL